MTQIAYDAVRGRPRRGCFQAVTRGIHRRKLGVAESERGWLADLSGWQLLLPNHGCFTAVTAARLRGWELPPIPAGTPVFVAMLLDDPRPVRAGIRTSRHPQPIAQEEVRGLRCAVPAETILACARWLSLIDLVALIDSALQAGDVTVETLTAVCAPHRRGRRALLTALGWADGRAESTWESLLRMLHVVIEVEVEPQVEIMDVEREFVARADLRVSGTKSLHEFDGGHHRDARQHRDDLRRERRLDAEGYVRRGYTASDVVNRPLGVLRDADRAVGRVHDHARIRPWLALLRASLYTPSGQAAFLARVTACPPSGGERR
ncbi:hypothetical protein [Nocardioides sp.]|uniref:hypothetical protein n=1 Tax=Nocardioides sp. TaxID=35761 RepID=UPI002BBFEBC6|nr:hypothetical protein [Nocardioides sp.]HXH77928.1 hypothetical protein [Nocardioides sp.]